MLPVLYSFVRCPYAMRARMALLYASIKVELREVLLKDKPPSMFLASPKGTVPVLLLPDGGVLDQSLDIMHWALSVRDPAGWRTEALAEPIAALIQQNDEQFKTHLDHYKYWERFPAESQGFYREQGEQFLARLETQLSSQRYLLAEHVTLADIALFPFIRQFAFVDKRWFDQAPYPKLQSWLQGFLNSPLFLAVMKKLPPWQQGDAVVLLQ